MNLNNLFPFGSTNQFPDNGIISQAYDLRVNQNDMRTVSSKLMKQGDPFYREEQIDGSGKYTWNEDFISMIDSAFATGVIPNFSKNERALFDEYVAFADESLVVIPSEDVVQLDLYLGSR